MEFIIAIDGPAGSGKSSVAKNIAKRMDFTYLDTGAMYRAVTLKFIKEEVEFANSEKIKEILKETKIDINGSLIYIDGEEVTAEIRKREVTALVSKTAALKEVRESMVEQQRAISKGKKVILDGRDIGTVVFPNADVKIFLVASPYERAARRVKDYEKLGQKVSHDDVVEEILKRDKEDMERENSPLVKASDAVEVDTTSMTIEEVENRIVEIIEKKMMDKIL